MTEKRDDGMLSKEKPKVNQTATNLHPDRKNQIRELTHKICDRNDEALRRLSKN